VTVPAWLTNGAGKVAVIVVAFWLMIEMFEPFAWTVAVELKLLPLRDRVTFPAPDSMEVGETLASEGVIWVT